MHPKNIKIRTVYTYTNKAPLAFGVAKHFIRSTLLQRVDSLAGKLSPVGWVYGTELFGLKQDIREQEEHFGFGLRAFRGHYLQPAFPNVPPPYEKTIRENLKDRIKDILIVAAFTTLKRKSRFRPEGKKAGGLHDLS